MAKDSGRPDGQATTMRPESEGEYYHYRRLLVAESILFVALFCLQRATMTIHDLLVAGFAGQTRLAVLAARASDIAGDVLPWALIWLAAAIGMTLNVWWGVAYHGFVKLDHRSRRAFFRKMEIAHAGFVTTFLFGLGQFLLPSAVLPAGGLANPISLTFAALLGYFSREAFKILYDGFLKLLKMSPNLQLKPTELAEGADHPLRSLTAPSLSLAERIESRAQVGAPEGAGAAAVLRNLVHCLENHDIRYTHELLASLPTRKEQDDFLAKGKAPQPSRMLKGLVEFSALANAVPDLTLAADLYSNGLDAASALAPVRRGVKSDRRYRVALEYAELAQNGLPDKEDDGSSPDAMPT